MQVQVFAPSLRAALDEDGGVTTGGFPMTSATVGSFPIPLHVPVVLAVSTRGGTDYDPRLHMVATSPGGERVGEVQCGWHWPDKPGVPVKFWVATRLLTMMVASAGVYTVGLYTDPDATEAEQQFLLPVLKANPYLSSSAQPSRS